MTVALLCTLMGLLMVLMVAASTTLARWPFSTSIVYLVVGLLISPIGLSLVVIDPAESAPVVERLTEVVVLLSLFTAGLKLSAGLRDRRWMPPLRLAVVSMLVAVVALTLVGVTLMGLSLGAAILLAGILAPTDPVLASDVQVVDPTDRDRLRFALTGEGGLNDGTAFPIVMLGLGLLGLHDIGDFGWRWFAVDVVWATAVGVAIGAALGMSVGRLVLYLRRRHSEAVGYDNFLALGLIALSCGVALMAHAYAFLAVFAAGVAFRQVEQRDHPATDGPDAASARQVSDAFADPAPGAGAELATHPRHASTFMAHAVLSFNEQLDRFGEMIGVICIGVLLWAVDWHEAVWWFVPLLLLVVRPLSAALGLLGSGTSRHQTRLIGWFGIRGVGSIFYLMYALTHGVTEPLADQLIAITLSVVVTSIVLHGVSMTPLMASYRRRRARSPEPGD